MCLSRLLKLKMSEQMDCSGLLEIVTQEIQLFKGLALENHLYGCLSLWEQWAEGELMLIDGKGQWNDVFFDISLDSDWSQMGQTFGFEETSPPYTGSEAYRRAWHTVFTASEWKDIARVDAVEEPLFARGEELGAAWLLAALPTGELPAGFVPTETRKETREENTTGGKQRKRTGLTAYKKTRRTRGRRSLTPVHCHHTLQTTRRHKRV
jgi:hypothetical protein